MLKRMIRFEMLVALLMAVGIGGAGFVAGRRVENGHATDPPSGHRRRALEQLHTSTASEARPRTSASAPGASSARKSRTEYDIGAASVAAHAVAARRRPNIGASSPK